MNESYRRIVFSIHMERYRININIINIYLGIEYRSSSLQLSHQCHESDIVSAVKQGFYIIKTW